MNDIIENDTLKWLFISGKGGVGKTTLSSSIAIELTKHKKNVLLVSLDPAHSTSDFFQQTFSTDPILVNGYSNLYCIEYNFKNNIDRTNDYRFDPLVDNGSAGLDDYHGSGYDMGHLAPAKIMSHNYTSMSESFYLSNISPQVASFNRGIWKTLESKVRYWASDKDSIYVFTGPILDNPVNRIGKNNVSVPRAFYKTLLGFYNGRIEGLAFIIPNEQSKKSIFSFVTSIDEVEQITGIDFYYSFEKKIQDQFESNKDVKKWISKN